MAGISYVCYSAGIIAEKPYLKPAQFSTAKKYEVLYQEALPQFPGNPLNIYALPFAMQSQKSYLGLNREGLSVFDDFKRDLTEKQKTLAKKITKDYMFICRWHGCDAEGTLFAEDFQKLNENGLFSTWQDAYDYMVKYLRED